jgi:hypothetical protein
LQIPPEVIRWGQLSVEYKIAGIDQQVLAGTGLLGACFLLGFIFV